MKYIFAAMVFLHGAIHLMGFVKAFKWAQIEQLTVNIPRFSGILWMISFLLFTLTAITFLMKVEWWYIPAFIGIIISTILIISTWQDAKFGTIANVIILTVGIVAYGTSAFHGRYEKDVKIGLKNTNLMEESILTEADIVSLPLPVKKYIRYAGYVGKPKVNNFRLEFSGQIRKDEKSEWMPFTTVQYNFMEESSRLFFMKAEMKKLPVAGYHCFKMGKAFMDIRLFSLFKVQYQSGNEMDISETVTFFNDMCCMAPGTLIDKRIKWLEVDGNNVKAEFSNNNITISAHLYFNEKGELINFISEDRYAYNENAGLQKFPWSTPLKDYKEVDGYNLSSYAEAIYKYPEGDLCYGTFNITQVEYNCENLK